MNIINFIFSWSWCSGEHSIAPLLHLIKEILNIIRIIVPIGLILMTTLDISKKVINPDDKDGGKKIMIRAIAALIVFLVPTIISITFKIIDWSNGNDGSYDNPTSGLSQCWR